jgi:RHH-type proline utilization regulon transcriptional repressor/proline dehydrogenase/delta 1-pyrroline-5-carboxylate dehydrogenase
LAVREQFVQALQQVAARLGGDYPMLFDGQPLESGQWLPSDNPANPQQRVGRVACVGAQRSELVGLVDRAIDSARLALPGWRDRGMLRRAALLRCCADALQQRRDEFAAWLLYEAGKSWREADAEVCEAIDFLRYYADSAEALAHGENWSRPGELNHGHWRPRGVALVIPPWNFPLAITAGMTAAALVTGNSVVLKPSSRTPVVAALLVGLMHAAGVPGGVLQFLPGRGSEVGDRLVSHPGVNLITFTGSVAVGSGIVERAARQYGGRQHFCQVLAEMGGKNAIIVDADADLDEAVRAVISSAFGYQGQKCSACSRVVVVGSAQSAFSDRLAAAAASLRCGDPLEPGNTLGPVIDAKAASAIRAAIKAGRDNARLLYAGHGDGNFIGPTIFDRVTGDSALATRELFGPVLSVFAADDFSQALAIANQCRYALAGGVFSRNPVHLKQAADRFEVGNLYLNRGITGALVGHQPFGGYRLSGLGDKAGGPDTLRRYMLPYTITENSLRRGFAPRNA